jgi:hypothetical protein
MENFNSTATCIWPKWITVARWDGKNLDGYDLALKGFTSLYGGYPIQFNGSKYTKQTWEVLLAESEYDQCPSYIKALNESVKKDSLTDQINNAIKGILDRVLLEDTLNKLELISSLLDDLVGMDTLKEYPAIESLIVDLYNALLDSDSPLNR